MDNRDLVIQRFEESIEIKKQVIDDKELISKIVWAADKIVDSISKGNKLVICGNGGSASDALHFAAEIVGRFQRERNPWPAIALNSDVATITAIANDYGYEDIFTRQTKGILKRGDIFIGISTSGNSENVYRAICAAKEIGAVTMAFLGKDGGKIKALPDCALLVRGDNTARVQEVHICIIHVICEMIEMALMGN